HLRPGHAGRTPGARTGRRQPRGARNRGAGRRRSEARAMSRKPARSFTARPGDAERWIRSAEAADPDRPATAFTARLTIDVTPALRRRLKLAALTRGCSVADMLRALLNREFP